MKLVLEESKSKKVRSKNEGRPRYLLERDERRVADQERRRQIRLAERAAFARSNERWSENEDECLLLEDGAGLSEERISFLHDRPVHQIRRRLTALRRDRHKVDPELRSAVLERDDWTCRYCGRELGTAETTLDHVVPRSKGGEDSLANLVTACRSCNSAKAANIWVPLPLPD